MKRSLRAMPGDDASMRSPALGGLASQKWAASRQRAVAAATAASATVVDAFALYGSDSDDGGSPAKEVLGAVVDYGSGPESSAELGEGAATSLLTDEPARARGDGDKRAGSAGREHGGAGDAAPPPGGKEHVQNESRGAHDGGVAERPPKKRSRALPGACDALSAAAPAAAATIAIERSQEPSREQQRAALHAEQAERIRELFFWKEGMSLLGGGFSG